MKFRKKPVVIEAVQWTGDNFDEVAEFTRRGVVNWVFLSKNLMREQDDLYVRTLEGPLRATVNDWIIKGMQGEFYPCKPDIFDAIYERVEDAEA